MTTSVKLPDPVRKINGERVRYCVIQFADVKDELEKVLIRKEFSDDSNLTAYLHRGLHDVNRIHDFSYKDDGVQMKPNRSDVERWMKYGFTTRDMLNSAMRTPMAFRPTPSWNEEDGDIDFSRIEAGFDDFYFGPTNQMSKPGIVLRFESWFSAGVPGTVIAEYGVWIMQLIAGMESMGFDLTIDAWTIVDQCFESDRARTNIAMRVKNPGETNDMTSYSCLFSPIGTRLLTFTGMSVAAQKYGKRVSSYFGMSIANRDWGLDYNPDEGVITITAAQRASYQYGSRFPAKELTEAAVKAGLIPSQDS